MYEIVREDLLKAQQNNKESMAKIIESNSGLLWSIVKRFLGRGYEKEDLYQIACVGFIKAIKRFDVNYNIRLSTYAVPYILGEIKRFIRDDGLIKVSRSLKELAIKIKEVKRNYLIKNGEDIKISELSQILNVPKEEIIASLESEMPVQSIDEDVYKNNSDGSNKEPKISKMDNGRDEIENLINRICLNDLIKSLNIKEQKIIILRYYKGKTQSEVAKLLGTSQVQVSRLEKRVLLSLRKKIA